jgi:hypothetical protein
MLCEMSLVYSIILDVSFYSELIIIIIAIKCNFYFGNVLNCSVFSFVLEFRIFLTSRSH